MSRANSEFRVVSLRDMIEYDKAGKINLDSLISGFSCAKNPDIELFLKKSAIEFTKKQVAVTYLVTDEVLMSILGYFALTMKALTLDGNAVDDVRQNLSSKKRARFDRFCVDLGDVNCGDGSVLVQTFLIAQLGKSDEPRNNPLPGWLLLNYALQTIKDVQSSIGGLIVSLEANPAPKLISFYKENGFIRLGSRTTDKGEELNQLIRVL